MAMSDETLEERFGGADRDNYQVETLLHADWAGRKMIHAKAEMERVGAEFDAAIAQWQEAKDAAVRKITRDVDFFDHHLMMFLIHQVEADPDEDPNVAKTIDLPCGVQLMYRPKPTGDKRLVIDDEKAVLEWCRDNLPDALVDKVVAKVLKDALKRGAPVTGCHLSDPESIPYRVSLPKGLR